MVSDDNGETWSKPSAVRTVGDPQTAGKTAAAISEGNFMDYGYTRNAVRSDGKVVTVYYYYKVNSPDCTIQATIWDPAVVFGSASHGKENEK